MLNRQLWEKWNIDAFLDLEQNFLKNPKVEFQNCNWSQTKTGRFNESHINFVPPEADF